MSSEPKIGGREPVLVELVADLRQQPFDAMRRE
jgi:hypothetical protein